MQFQNDIEELPRLNDENMENIFRIYQNANDVYYYNLLQTIHFPSNLPANYFEQYEITYGDTWPLIAHKAYGEIRLWWVIALANNINNPIQPLQPGTTLKIPIANVVTEILTQIITSKE